MQATRPKQFQLAKVITPAIFLIGFLVLDVIYVRWAWLSDNPQADVPARIAIGLILGIVTVLVAMTVKQRIAAALKGSLRIDFTDRPYSWDDTISGEILLQTRGRLLVERLTLTLFAERCVPSGSNNSHRWEKIIEQSEDLPIDENLLPGTRRILFSVRIPARPARHASEWPSELKSVGALLEGVQRAFNPLDLAPQLRWTLEARAHMPGADLDDSHTLRFNSSYENS